MIDIVFMIESFKSMPLWLQIIICILSLVFIIGTVSIMIKAEEEGKTSTKLLMINIMDILLLINIVIFYNQEDLCLEQNE